ncbi:MAG: hypothetical protein FJ253_04990 [Phycisphaerae bacterium]|nr:hypothetical protein [Phycisphaerae bacterium]
MAPEHGTTARRLNFGFRTAPVPTLIFLGGVFLTFAPLMFMTLRTGEQAPWSTVALAFVLSGICAVFWAMGGILSVKWFFVALPAQLVVAFIVPTGLLGRYGVRSSGLDSVGLLSVACIAIGYACFCVVIVGYARRAISMATEMDLAAQIHRHLVPSIAIASEGYELAAESRPSGAMGGDVLHAVALPDGSIEAAVADVSGHGVRAGVVMAMVKATIESARDRALGAFGAGRDAGAGVAPHQARGAVDGRRLVKDIACELNRVLHALTEPDMFVTAAIVHADAHGRVHAVIAGHPPALRVSGGAAGGVASSAVAAGTRRVTRIGGPGLPLGVVPEFEPEAFESQLEPGDSLVLYTDGLTEATIRSRNGASNRDAKQVQRLEIDGLEAIVRAGPDGSAALASDILGKVDLAAGGVALEDDRSVLVLSRTH